MDDFKQLSPNENASAEEFPSLVALIQSHGKTIADLLTCDHDSNVISLSKTLGRSKREIEEYISKIKQELSVKPNSLKNLLKSRQFIETGLSGVDRQLGGGIPLGEITEIYGASGTGKSHLLFQLCFQCQLISKKCIYISTESFLETKRLQDIHDAYKDKGQAVSMDDISYIYCQNLESQDHIMYTQLPILLEKSKDVGLIVVDSIAQHLRRENAIANSTYLAEKIEAQEKELVNCKDYQAVKFQHEQQLKKINKSDKYKNRSTKFLYLYTLHRYLTRIARKYGIAVVVVNQVSDYMSGFEYDDNPLSLDFQQSIHSGWDARTIYQQFQEGNAQSLVCLNTNELALIESTLEGLRGQHENNKRFKLETTADPATNEGDLIMKWYQHKNTTKKLVPTLGYPWAKRINNRIMLMKSYKPIIRAEPPERESSQHHRSGNHEDNIKVDATRKRANPDSPDTPIQGWSVVRYVKVVSSSFNPVPSNTKIEFELQQTGLAQVS